MAAEWTDVAIKAGISLVSALSGAFIAVWKWGRDSSKADQAVRDDYVGRISALREEMRTAMAAHADKSSDGKELLVIQFKESFEGIRRQHDDHKLDVERRFVLKDDFKEFREEYRDDMKDLKGAIANIARSR